MPRKMNVSEAEVIVRLRLAPLCSHQPYISNENAMTFKDDA